MEEEKIIPYNPLKDYVDSICIISSDEHFLYCPCCSKQYEKLKDEMMYEEKKVVDGLESLGDDGKRYRLGLIPSKARKLLFQKKQGKLCWVEKDELLSTIKIFEGRYDLTDPRVYAILKSLLDIQLTSFRMQRESSYSGVMVSSLDKYGNPIKSVNPVEEVKRRYNETFIKAIEILNKIIEGEKHLNVNLELSGVKVFKREELYNND